MRITVTKQAQEAHSPLIDMIAESYERCKKSKYFVKPDVVHE